MYTSTLLYLLPLLAPLVSATSQETRELYEAASRRLVSRDDTDSHGHGKYNALLNSHGHGHVASKKRTLSNNHSSSQKLVRRKKVNHKNKKRGNSTCKAKPTSSSTESESVIATATGTIPAVQNNANAKPSSSSASSSSSSSAAEWEETAYPTMSSTNTWDSAASASASASATSTGNSWESSSVNTQQPSSTSSAQAESTSSSSGGSGSGSSGNSLFPWGTGSASWTTSDGGLSFEGALKPLTAGKLPSSGSAPDGSNALVASYPAGTVGLSSAGFSFYTEGAHNGVQVDGASEVSFSYSVYLKDGFEFVKGGKMPGLYGGTSLSQAKSCSGGRQDGRDSCFSARLMWRTNGAGEIYDYLPVPYTNTDTGYGESIQRGAYSWATGRWTTVAMRVKLNDIGQANGEQELMVDGQSVISLKDVTFATAQGTKIYGIMAQTFFGGHTDDWASPSDQNIWFKDWSLAVLA
ncbi:uncharacterized protein I303_108541 [Kwoniella dejecticola CBS 10117]|uniref:Polysaccharide lyase 14 domain-containing protein n=1 Tax=Kwoniella dejecticola CBS 10117 TaxID=1296121 RepID=A0A1A5ZX42_9TREE|nr:uncharacterized protein I303_07135 [Kwoniella dejecticola CBS 10117]OBR82376.1 hypothetical protein I303_07135 [Kwoniella dejecticola CBS 10117]